MNVLLDTNIILRLAEPTHAQYRLARDAADLLAQQGSTRPVAQNGRGKTPDEVLVEFAFLESHFTAFPDIPAVFAEWKQLMAAYKVVGKPAHDARLVAAMLAHGITHILTFNGQDFSRYVGIAVLDPAGVAPPPPTP